MSGDEVVLAAVTGAHGIKGEVRLKLFGDGIASLKRHGAFAAGGRALTLTTLRPDKGGAIAAFAEIGDRNAAEALRGTTLSVPRASLPPLGEGEYYHADYIGMAVVAPDGAALGVVRAIENYGASDLLDITRPDGRAAMVPFTRDIVAEVDGKLIVDPVWLA